MRYTDKKIMHGPITFSDHMRRFLSTGTIVCATLLVYRFFPADPGISRSLQAVSLGFFLFLLVPILHVSFILREPLSSIGFSGSVSRFGFLMVPLTVVPAVILWYLSLRTLGDVAGYALPGSVYGSFPLFVLYETVLVGLIVFMYEVFFRGLVMLSWLKRSGIASIFLQVGIFAAFIAFSGGLGWGQIPMILSALASGVTAFRTKSVYYSWLSGWLVWFLSDAVFLLM